MIFDLVVFSKYLENWGLIFFTRFVVKMLIKCSVHNPISAVYCTTKEQTFSSFQQPDI